MADLAKNKKQIRDQIKAGVHHPILAALCGVSGFVLSYSYVFYIIGAYASSCGHRHEDAYLSALILGGITVALSISLIHAGRRQAAFLRWLVLPHAVTTGFIISMLPGYLIRVSVLGEHICAQGRAGFGQTWPAALGWHRFYAPIMVLYVLVFAGYMLWYFPYTRHNGNQKENATKDPQIAQWKFLAGTWAMFLGICIGGSAIAEIWYGGTFKNFLVGAFVAPGGPISWFVIQEDVVYAVKVTALSFPVIFLMGLHPYLGRIVGRWTAFTGVFLWFLTGAMAMRYTPL